MENHNPYFPIGRNSISNYRPSSIDLTSPFSISAEIQDRTNRNINVGSLFNRMERTNSRQETVDLTASDDDDDLQLSTLPPSNKRQKTNELSSSNNSNSKEEVDVEFIEHKNNVSSQNTNLEDELLDLNQDDEQTEEDKKDVRLAPFRKKISEAAKENIKKAQKENIFVIMLKPFGSPQSMSREFVILGSNGNVYKVNICTKPNCDCEENKKGTSTTHCVHILFVYLKVFKMEPTDLLIVQKALLNSELSSIFKLYRGLTGVVADSMVVEKYLELTSNERPKKRKIVEQKQIDGDCPICYEKMLDTEKIVYCKYSCGNSVHLECFNKWMNVKKETDLNETKCIYCRSKWDIQATHSVHIKEGYLNLAEYQDRVPNIPPYLFLMQNPNLIRFRFPALQQLGLEHLQQLFRNAEPSLFGDDSDDDDDEDEDDDLNSDDSD